LGEEENDDDLNDEDGNRLASVDDHGMVTHVGGIIFNGIETGYDTVVDSCSFCESVDRVCRSVE
jgi:hypothetical protein